MSLPNELLNLEVVLGNLQHASQRTVSGGMDKDIVVHPYAGLGLSSKES